SRSAKSIRYGPGSEARIVNSIQVAYRQGVVFGQRNPVDSCRCVVRGRMRFDTCNAQASLHQSWAIKWIVVDHLGDSVIPITKANQQTGCIIVLAACGM